jgi:toxin ParE1/3/4
VPDYQLTANAERDLRSIARYTIYKWSEEQAKKYADSLEECFNLLSSQPRMGRKANSKHGNIRRHEHKSHIIIYRVTPNGIRVLRVMHQQSFPEMRDVD